jgi:hypothetical protein
MGQKMCLVATRQNARRCTKVRKFRSSMDSAVEPLIAITLAPSLEHAPSVPQGVGSDKLIKDVRTIMYLVCLVALVSKE